MKTEIRKLINEINNLVDTDFSGLQSWNMLRIWPVGESRNLNGCTSTKVEQGPNYIIYQAELPPGHIFEAHWHNCFEEIEVISGFLEDYENPEIKASEGETVTIPPWVSHSPCNPSDNWLILRVKFSNPSNKKISWTVAS